MINKISLWEKQMDLLAQQDYTVIDDFLEISDLEQVLSFFKEKVTDDKLAKAAIGVTGKEKIIEEIRGDYTFWLDKARDSPSLKLFDTLDEMKSLINRMFFLSLSDYEFHLALYPIGSFYKKHLDQFQGRNNRMISMVLYLNENWTTGDGGELKIYPINEDPITIDPLLNRCVLFRSDTLYHEVLTAQCDRKSVTGWMLYLPTPLAAIPGI
jgi:SM-20-related protein